MEATVQYSIDWEPYCGAVQYISEWRQEFTTVQSRGHISIQFTSKRVTTVTEIKFMSQKQVSVRQNILSEKKIPLETSFYHRNKFLSKFPSEKNIFSQKTRKKWHRIKFLSQKRKLCHWQKFLSKKKAFITVASW